MTGVWDILVPYPINGAILGGP